MKIRTIYIYSFWITLVVAIGLVVGGFFMPPAGEISGTVITAVGELFCWVPVALVAKVLEDGKSATFKKGELEIEVKDKKSDDEG